MSGAKLARFRQLVSLANGRRMPTVSELFPSLTGVLPDETLQQTAGDFFRIGLLQDAPSTWLNDPGLPLDGLNAQAVAAVRQEVGNLAEQADIASKLGLLTTPGALALVKAAWAARVGDAATDAKRCIDALLALEPDQLLPAGVVNPAVLDPEAVFEARVRGWARAIHAAAEGAYVPLLKTAVDLTNLAMGRGLERWPRKSQLGNVLKTARERWSHVPEFQALLHDDVLTVRNAVAHPTIVFEVQSERVRMGAQGRLLTEHDVAEIGGRLFGSILAMYAAMRLVADERFIRASRREGFVAAIVKFVLQPLSAEESE